jgi:hypothetical protein
MKEIDMLTNPVSKIFVILAVLAAAFVTISFVSQSRPTQAELSRPARPVILPLPGNADLSDYFLRHSEQAAATAPAGIPVTGADELSDFYQRHTDWAVVRAPLTSVIDLSDYYQRFQAMKSASTIVDTSDYFMRHSNSGNPSVDTSDYFLRHRK